MIKNIPSNEIRILIPDLSDEYSTAVMDAVLDRDMNNIFWYENPPLYLAKNKFTNDLKSCATLKTLRDLINEDVQFVFLENTQDSAKYCAEGKTDTCITNQHGIDNNNLEPIRKLKEMKVMWVPFLIRP